MNPGDNLSYHLPMSHLAVVPVNGIGNRLRAIAACLYLGRKLKRGVTIVWEPDSLLPGNWEELFVNSPELKFVSMKTAQQSGIVPQQPIALYVDSDQNFLTLRGNDRGEQRFALQFYQQLGNSLSKNGVVMAGDYFHHRATSVEKAGALLQKERLSLANKLTFSQAIVDHAQRLAPREPYLSLHLRGTDRVSDTANPTSLLAAALQMSRRRGLTTVFVASEDNQLIDMAKAFLKKSGLKMASNPELRTRQTLAGTISAFGDYLVLRGGVAYVGSRQSTFSSEIGVTFPGRRKVLI